MRPLVTLAYAQTLDGRIAAADGTSRWISGEASLVRTHQLRAHMAALGLPLVNDTLYPVLQAEAEPNFAQPLQLLAQHIALRCPVRGTALAFSSDMHLALPA